MLCAQPGMPFLSLILWPTPIHHEEAQHWCPILSADFPASNKSSSPLQHFPDPTGWEQLYPALEALGQLGLGPLGPPALLAQDGHMGPPAVNPTGNNVVLCSWLPLLSSLALVLTKAAAASPFDRRGK